MIKTNIKEYSFQEINNKIRVIFKQNNYFEIDKDFTDIEYEIKDNQLCFNTENEKKIKKIMHKILSYAEYKNIFTNKKIYYINEQSQIPLIGSIAYGLIDRGSNIIEIRPNTGCNMNCQFCSVDEGLSSKKSRILC